MPHSLYVGDLSTQVTEAKLYEIFKSVGPVSKIHIVRDWRTRTSLGYAYVNFHSAKDAERALDTLNHSMILNCPCRIMWSQRDAASFRIRKSGEGNVFVSNLSKTIDNRTLLDTFSLFGNVLSCKVVYDPKTGKSWGQGYVQYESDSSADKAIAKVNGMEIDGKAVYVTKWKSLQEREEYNKENYVSVYIKNFPDEWEEVSLRKLAAEFGEFWNCMIPKDDDGKSKGFGFMNFRKSEVAKKAVEELNGREIESKNGEKMKLYVARAQSKRERQKILKEKYAVQGEEEAKRNIYVKGLLDTVDKEQLSAVFSKIGEISSCRVMKEKNGASKGFGFVLYESEEDAKKCIEEFNSKEVPELGLSPLHVAIASKSKPRQQRQDNSIWAESDEVGENVSRITGGYKRLNNQFSTVMRYNSQGTPMNFPGYRQLGFPAGGSYSSNLPVGSPIFSYHPMPYHQVTQRQPKRRSKTCDKDLTKIMSLPQQEQKQLIGEKIFAEIERMRGKTKDTGKITGMLLEMDSASLIQLLQKPRILRKKIKLATEVYTKYQETQAVE